MVEPRFNPEVVRESVRVLGPVMKKYFRSEVRGMEHVPEGQALFVAHHDGGVIPVNGLCFGAEWHEHFAFTRPLYVLVHDIILGTFGVFTSRLAESGLMPADRRSMDAALATGESVFVMPGAARETFRSWWERREIDLGGRTGFLAQAIRWKLPVVPVVSAGSHETVIVLHGGHDLARRVGLRRLVRSADALPLQAGLPYGLWALPFLPQIPLPARITTEVLPPIHLEEALGRTLTNADAEDPRVLRSAFNIVLGRMRERLSLLYEERTWPILG